MCDVGVGPVRVKLMKFEFTADIEKSGTETTDKIVMDDVIVNFKSILS